MKQVTNIAKVTKTTIRRWEQAGKIPKPSKRALRTDHRLYSEEELAAIIRYRDTNIPYTEDGRS